MATKIEPLMTTADVAAVLRCSQDHVVDLFKAGKLLAAPVAVSPPSSGRPGRRMLRFRPDDVRAFIEAQLSVCEPEAVAAPPRGSAMPAPSPVAGGESMLRRGRKGGRR